MASSELTISILVTTFEKSFQQIKSLVFLISGQCDCIIRNQITGAGKDEHFVFWEKGTRTDYFLAYGERGASKNRNALIKLATSDFVIIPDDDAVFVPGSIKELVNFLNDNDCDAVKFLISNTSEERPTPKNEIHKLRKKANYFDCTDCGPWSFAYRRSFLVDHNVFFNEQIGPGTKIIKSGEDKLFSQSFFRAKGRMLFFNQTVLTIAQTDSTWFQGYDRVFLCSISGAYYLLYRPLHCLFLFRYLFRIRKKILVNKKDILPAINEGIKAGKAIRRENLMVKPSIFS